MPPENNTPPNNPYAKQAASAYGETAKKTPNQRELEGQLLLKSASALQELANNAEVATPSDYDMALTYNRKLWTVFYDAALENTEGNRPNDLRSNIINLSNFVFKRTLEIQAERDKTVKTRKLEALVNINREIAAGLLMNANAQQSEADGADQNPGSQENSAPRHNDAASERSSISEDV